MSLTKLSKSKTLTLAHAEICWSTWEVVQECVCDEFDIVTSASQTPAIVPPGVTVLLRLPSAKTPVPSVTGDPLVSPMSGPAHPPRHPASPLPYQSLAQHTDKQTKAGSFRYFRISLTEGQISNKQILKHLKHYLSIEHDKVNVDQVNSGWLHCPSIGL